MVYFIAFLLVVVSIQIYRIENMLVRVCRNQVKSVQILKK